MTLTAEERETVIRFDDSADQAYIWTASAAVAARLRKAGLAVAEEPGGWSARCPKQAVRIKWGRLCYVGGRSKVQGAP